MEWKLLWEIFILFTRVALFSWGGGPASLALMQREVVTAGWASNEEFADAVAVGNALPGPIAPQVSAYVGYKISGLWGAISATMGTVFPTTLLMLIMVVYFFSIKDSPAVAAMLKAVRPVVVGDLVDAARAVLADGRGRGLDRIGAPLVGNTRQHGTVRGAAGGDAIAGGVGAGHT